VRITAQLIDAATGNHIWADRYDGELSDVFALQDKITNSVVADRRSRARVVGWGVDAAELTRVNEGSLSVSTIED
jgi:hypothetical protein